MDELEGRGGACSIDTPGVPFWAKDVVWYQIFPERFRNGDRQNDPTLDSLDGADPHDLESPWQVHPWTSDWYELQPYEQANGRDIWFNLVRRRYGGDLQGIIDKLDYLDDLGIGAIYLNPVFASPSLHKYDGTTYHHVDPHFGPDPEGDVGMVGSEVPRDPTTWVWTRADMLFLELVQRCHDRGIRVIIDGVFNHVGIRHWAFRDVVEKGPKSPFADWFTIESWGERGKAESMKYSGWWGVRELPEWRQNENGIVPGPRRYIFDITRRWMDPSGNGDISRGVDGWRLDVASCIRHAFWKDWRIHVKSINPDAYLVAELVNDIEDLKPFLRGDEFDAVMNYNFAFACAEFFVEEATRITASEFDRRLAALRHAFPEETAYAQQNLLDSHDSDRFASHIVNRNLGGYRAWMEYHRISKGRNPDYSTRRPNQEERAMQKVTVIFQLTYLGAPMIYYGDEAGMWGANDPCCRKPMLWDDQAYDDEVMLPSGAQRPQPQPVSFDHEMHRHYRKLIGIRNDYAALRRGDFRAVLADDDARVYAFSRSLEGQEIVVILSAGATEQTVTIGGLNGHFRDVLNEDEPFESVSSAVSCRVPGRWGRILVRQEQAAG